MNSVWCNNKEKKIYIKTNMSRGSLSS